MNVTETVYRQEIRLALTKDAVAKDKILKKEEQGIGARGVAGSW